MFSIHHAAWRPLTDPEDEPMDAGSPLVHPYEPRLLSNQEDELMIERENDFNPFAPVRAATRPYATMRNPMGSSQELTARFARALSLRETRAAQIASMRMSTRKSKATSSDVSKNCGKEKKLKKREQQRRRQNNELEGRITQLQMTIAALERSKTLMDSHILLWKTNRTGVVVDVCREYFAQFSEGYVFGGDGMKTMQRLATKNFVYSVAEENLVCREYLGIDKLLQQWEIYTKYHGDIKVRLSSISLIDEEDELVSICCSGEMDLEISADTLRHLYPDFYAAAQQNAATKQLAESLIGKRYVLPFDKVLHFNRYGKVFAHESKVHLATGLLATLKDPFAAMQVMQGSVMTVDGHWKTTDVDYMKVKEEEMYDMPKLML